MGPIHHRRSTQCSRAHGLGRSSTSLARHRVEMGDQSVVPHMFPTLMLLSRAYDRGDFSMSYPIVRGAGALAAAAGGVLFFNDTLSHCVNNRNFDSRAWSFRACKERLMARRWCSHRCRIHDCCVLRCRWSWHATISTGCVRPCAQYCSRNICFTVHKHSTVSKQMMIPTLRAQNWKIMGAAGVFLDSCLHPGHDRVPTRSCWVRCLAA
jgi:hypothetical protein